MVKRTATAILVCAIMVLVAAVPLALAGTHLITKYEKGPNASAVTWEYVPESYGSWWGHIVNNGLRWVVVDVYDNTIGAMDQIMHQRIRFAAYNAYPSGEVDTQSVLMVQGRTYAITVTPNGPRGNSCTVEDMFERVEPPIARFTATVTYQSVFFDATASEDPDGMIMSYAWNFGDGQTGTGMQVTHEYAEAKTYTVSLVVTDDDGLTGSTSQDVTTTPPPATPVARFTATPNWMVVSVDASTSSDSDGWIVSYTWDWGDGSSDTLTTATATHTYTVEKTYTIRLTVTDDDGWTGWVEHDVIARMPHPPSAAFTPTMDWMVVSVNAGSSSDSDGTVVSYSWNWGDGSSDTLTTATATHTYTVEKVYTITLTVKDNDGLTSDPVSHDVTARMPHPPTASFIATPAHLSVAVDATGSSDTDGTIVSYTWNWGDGSPAETLTEKTASHIYTTKGLKTITLTVKDNDLLTDTTTRDVTLVDNFPTAAFTWSAAGLVLSVDATDSKDDYGIVSYTWNWGDGTPEVTVATPTTTHTYVATATVSRVIVSSYSVAPMSVTPNQVIPPPPGFYLGGYTRDESGALLPYCDVTITLVKTGESATVSSGSIAFYVYTPTWSAMSVGDQIKVTAVKGDLSGESIGYIPYAPNMMLDVTLYGAVELPHEFNVTLTVKDMLGQATTVSQVVVIYW